MKIIYVDDEKTAISNFKNYMEQKPYLRNHYSVFNSAASALDYVYYNPIDVAFLDIDMPEMNGLQLAEKLRAHDPNILIVFVTAYPQYTLQAYQVKGIGFVLKPYTTETMDDIFALIHVLRPTPTHSTVQSKSSVFLRTFGYFDLIINGTPVLIENAKTKELLALLLNYRGASLTNSEIFGHLWEDKDYNSVTSSYIRRIRTNLKNILEAHDVSDLVQYQRNAMNFNMKFFETNGCDSDYLRAMNGDNTYDTDYNGYYMKQYSWAEESIYALEKNIKSHKIQS